MPIITQDFSRTVTHNTCARLDYYKTILHLSGKQGSTALRNGSVIHTLEDIYYSEMKKGHFLDSDEIKQIAELSFKQESEGLEFEDDYRNVENICKLFEYYLYGDRQNDKDAFAGYFLQDSQNFEVLETEQYFEFELKLTPKERQQKGISFDYFIVNGLIDLKVKEYGLLTILEHKTTGLAIKSAAPGYIVSVQPIIYALATKETTGQIPAMAVTNLLHMVSKRKKDGEYGKLTLGCARFPTVITNEKLQQAREYLINTARKIAYAEETGNWVKCLNACSTKYGICGFLGLCEQGRELEDLYLGAFVERKWEPKKEILKIDNIKKEVFGEG